MLPTGTAYVDVRAIDPHVYLAQQNANRSTKPHSQNPGHPLLYLQVAAFANKSNANHLERRLWNEFHLPVRIAENTHSLHPIYKVQIGPIPTIQLSDHISTKLSQQGLGEPLAVIE